MTDRFVYSCRFCKNAVVGGAKPPKHDCPACGHGIDDVDRNMGLWKREGQIR